MSDISDSFMAGRRRAGGTARRFDQNRPDNFQIGVDWIRHVLEPMVWQADEVLQPYGVGVRFDVNLDRSSTNHAHADVWMVQTQTQSGQSYDGPKYSFNVIGSDIMLYKAGADGRSLGKTDTVGTDQIRHLLREAAEEYGALFRDE